MLAYRHAFHAGNYADVLKHVVLVAVLRYLNQKDKPYWVIDTHAGAGGYGLDSRYATQHNESATGIGRLWDEKDLPPTVADYLALVKTFNGDASVLRRYPGSPEIVRALLREGDRQRLFELHPTDFAILEANFGRDRRAHAEQVDGYTAIKSLLPPPPRRGLVFIDPSYEIKTDYTRVEDAVREGLQRFAQGVFMVWIPVLTRREPQLLIDRLKRVAPGEWLHLRLTVAEPDAGGFGMLGSSVFVVNPPWVLRDQMRETLPALKRLLGQYPGADFALESHAEPAPVAGVRRPLLKR